MIVIYSIRGAELYRSEQASPILALEEAISREADLRGANLRGADLRWADLRGADLRGANLSEADLRGANLRGADLSEADLRWANLPDDIRWETYLAEVVPALLTAGGKTIKDIVAAGAWDCHSWDNCPMRVALGIGSPGEGPVVLRAEIRRFVQFFDAGLIPCPEIKETCLTRQVEKKQERK